MNYGRKIYIRWTPRLKWVIVIGLSLLFIIGAIIGFIIGRATYPKAIEEKPQTTVKPTTTDIPSSTIAPIELPTATPTSSEPVIIFYYDCPLDNDLQDYIRELCKQYDLPMSLVIALIEKESSFRANVISGSNDYGLMQINVINHEWLKEQYDITDFLDPYQNVLCGISILGQHYNRYQDISKALMAYNLGATGAKRQWDKGVHSTSYSIAIEELMTKYENQMR